MEVCYRTGYSYSGSVVSKEKKVRLKYGEAYYAEHVGDYMILKQAHGYDEPDASPYQAVEIIHISTAQRVSLRLYDWSTFCPFVGRNGDLFIAQKNENGNLEIRRYDIASDMQESITEFSAECFHGKRFAYIQSATSIGNLAYLQVRLTNEEAAILTYDMEEGIITASSTLRAAPGSDYIVSVQSNGSVLLAVDGRWNEALQCYVLSIDAIDAGMGEERLSRSCMNSAFSFCEMKYLERLSPLKWMKTLHHLPCAVTRLAHFNELRPTPVVPMIRKTGQIGPAGLVILLRQIGVTA